MIRRIAAAVAAMAMLLILAALSMAGGWADIVADAQTTDTTDRGRARIRGRLHASSSMARRRRRGRVRPSISRTPGTARTFDVVAKNDRPDGHFVGDHDHH